MIKAKIVFLVEKSIEAELTYSLQARQNSTEVVHRAEATPCGIFRQLEPILSNIIRRERERTCQAIRQAFE
jgi:hypothetical protein